MQEIKEIFTKSPINTFKDRKPKKITAYSEYNIYPLRLLGDLIGIISAKNETKVRFLVDNKHQLWFAEEGPASKTIPAHYQMTNELPNVASCISAGNIIFSSDYKAIIYVNHKSGDFEPDFNSLQYLFAILIANKNVLTDLGISISPFLDVEELSSLGGPKCIYPKCLSDIEFIIKKIFTEDQMVSFKTQPLKLRISSYGAIEHSKEIVGNKRSICFFGDANAASTASASPNKKINFSDVASANANEKENEGAQSYNEDECSTPPRRRN